MFCSCNTISEKDKTLGEGLIEKVAFKNRGQLILIKKELVHDTSLSESSISWILRL